MPSRIENRRQKRICGMRNRFGGWLAVAAFALLIAAYQYYAFASLHGLLSDYRAFWCAGHAIASGLDPYRASSVLTCERLTMPSHLAGASAGVSVPAPLPGYALAIFVPFSLLPYPVAALLWTALLAAVSAACVRQLSRTLSTSSLVCAWILVLPATMLWLPYGQLVPIAMFGALLAADALNRGRHAMCAFGLCILALEPHLAVGAWLAVAVWERRMRLPLTVSALLILLVWYLATPQSAFEYLTALLPLHALAELSRDTQYSASWIAHLAGLSDGISLRIGTLSYLLMTLLGVFLSVRLARWAGCRALFVLAPLATAVVGGTFVHAAEIACAAPLALAMFVSSSGAIRNAFAVLLIALCVPWYQILLVPSVIPVVVAAAFAIASLLQNDRRFGLVSAACAGVLALLLLQTSQPHIIVPSRSAAPVALTQSDLVSASWGRELWRNESQTTAAVIAAKSITWCSLIVLLSGAAFLSHAGARRDESVVRSRSTYVEST